MKNVLIFGASGSIGSYLYNSFTKMKTYNVYGTTTKVENGNDNIINVTMDQLEELLSIDIVDIVVWAQGYNHNDNIYNFHENEYLQMMNVNVFFIIKTMNYLLKNDKIRDSAKMVIISSIWQNLSRDNKLSYSVSKSALSGLVKNVAFDLSNKNILINNILPGVIDNEMSRQTLEKEQFEYIQNYTPFNRLVSLEDIFNTVKFLCIENTGITGQSIQVDLGFTNIRKYS